MGATQVSRFLKHVSFDRRLYRFFRTTGKGDNVLQVKLIFDKAGVYVIAAFALLLLCAGPESRQAFAQTPGHRLILKDGSYQSITKYEIKGDRVRYFSAERGEWEEVPKELVDWDATKKYEDRILTTAPAPEAAELDKELAAEKQAADARSPQVAPGLRLPDDNGVYLLDSFQGQPQLDPIEQSGSDLNSPKSNILRSAINPLAGAKQSVELSQPHAKIKSHTTVPSLYVNLEPASSAPASAQGPGEPKPLTPSERLRIIRLDVKVDKRVAGSVTTSLKGNSKTDERFVPTTLVPISGGWFKITPVDPLPVGEYAVVEMLTKDAMNLDVWDFGVNSAAPANPSAWKSEPAEAPKNDLPKVELPKTDTSQDSPKKDPQK